ncbi:hypothetical protein DIS24_g5043 [Lasiodiplodia hormozganensis]|uniref:DUF1857-domain-containing protein n=1 Tax=Lasiodiplodia hormozganensis TaxID=869390 RepID=A0AA39YL93_9PEZI|nr:hypothetical protein DIS24_g5043 [Lasiodiplodia hormozganensis]
MVTINVAFTSPINPPGATPVLTLSQVWAGLERKIRFAQEFVPVILGTEVLEETTEGTGSEAVPVVVREATFKEGFREGDPKVKEVCKCYEPSRVDFHQPNGTIISNVISFDANDALNMTYSFAWRYPEVSASDAAAVAELRKKHRAGAQIAVESSIQAIREMVKDGRIKEA